MRVSDKWLESRAKPNRAWGSTFDDETVAAARELLAARRVVEAARGLPEAVSARELADALAAYDAAVGQGE